MRKREREREQEGRVCDNEMMNLTMLKIFSVMLRKFSLLLFDLYFKFKQIKLIHLNNLILFPISIIENYFVFLIKLYNYLKDKN